MNLLGAGREWLASLLFETNSVSRGPCHEQHSRRSHPSRIQQLDAVRELHERADTTDALWRAQTLVDDALRQATDFLFELRRKQLGI